MKPFVNSMLGNGCTAARSRYMWTHFSKTFSSASRCSWARFAVFAVTVPRVAAAQAAEVNDASVWLLGPIGITVLIAACAWAALHVLRQRRQRAGGDAELPRVIGATALGSRERIVVLRASGRVFMLGVTAHQVSMLAELDHADAVPAAPVRAPASVSP